MLPDRSISYRMTKMVVLITVFLGMIMGISQVIWDYENRINALNVQVGQILGSIEKPLIKAVYTYDHQLTREVALGLFEFPPITSVRIIDDRNIEVVVMERAPPALPHPWISQFLFEKTYDFNVPLSHQERTREIIGNMYIEVSPHVIADLFWNKSLTTLFSVLLQSFILALVLLALFYNLVTRPLHHLARDFGLIDPEKPQDNVLSTPASFKGSEFDDVAHAGNKMLRVMGNHLKAKENAEVELKSQKEETEKFLQIAEAIILRLDRDGKILMINQRGQDLLGCDLEELIGQNWFEIAIDQNERTAMRASFETLFQADKPIQSNYFENTILTHIGERRDIFWHNVVELDPFGRKQGILSSGQDITDLKRTKHALRETEGSQKKLEQQLRQSQKMETIGTLAGGIAHDLNNMLTPILGYSSILCDRLDARDPNHKRASKIAQSANRAAEMIKQILTFSKRNEGEMVSTSLKPVLDEVFELIISTTPSSIHLSFECENNCPPVFADPTQIQQVVMNLCTNAVHAMKDEGGTIAVSLKQKQVTDYYANMSPHLEEGSYLELCVGDDGTGMDEETIYRIFDPFFTTKTPEQGTGLGLAMVHGIIQNHKGDIFVESTPGQGSLFRIFLPITNAPVEKEKELISLKQGKSETILLVDDEKMNTELISEYLEESGYCCEKYVDSLDALEAFMLDPEKFDLLLTDQTMPKLTGEQLVTAIKEIRENIPVIMMSGFSKTMTRENAQDFGIDYYMDKPITIPDLNNALNDLLQP